MESMSLLELMDVVFNNEAIYTIRFACIVTYEGGFGQLLYLRAMFPKKVIYEIEFLP